MTGRPIMVLFRYRLPAAGSWNRAHAAQRRRRVRRHALDDGKTTTMVLLRCAIRGVQAPERGQKRNLNC